MAERDLKINTEKWPLKCDGCGRLIPTKTEYTDIADGLGISCGDEECTIKVEDAVDNDGC